MPLNLHAGPDGERRGSLSARNSERLAEEGKLEEAAAALAEKLANSPTQALSYQKRMINFTNYPDLELMQEFEVNFMPACS